MQLAVTVNTTSLSDELYQDLSIVEEYFSGDFTESGGVFVLPLVVDTYARLEMGDEVYASYQRLVDYVVESWPETESTVPVTDNVVYFI